MARQAIVLVVKIINRKQAESNNNLYPNPIAGDVIHLQFHRQTAGRYQIKLYNVGRPGIAF